MVSFPVRFLDFGRSVVVFGVGVAVVLVAVVIVTLVLVLSLVVSSPVFVSVRLLGFG